MRKLILVLLFLGLAGSPLQAVDVGFMGIYLGMTRDLVLSVAEGAKIIEVPRNRDVEFFPVEERKILTLSIRPEVPHMYLQFWNDRLYAITVIFDEKYVNYYTLADSLGRKYGSYVSVTPSWRKWEREGVEIKVEKPAVVKYIALEEFLEATDFRREEGYSGSERRRMLLEGL